MEKKTDFKKMTTKQKYDFIWNVFFCILLIPTSIGIYFLFRDTKKFIKDLKALNPSYKFPEISDLKLVLLILPIIITSMQEHLKLKAISIRVRHQTHLLPSEITRQYSAEQRNKKLTLMLRKVHASI